MSRNIRVRGQASDIDISSVALPSWDGAAHTCGGVLRLVREPAEVPIRGTTVIVDREFYRCTKCGEEQVDLQQMEAARQAAARKLNENEQLLQPEEILALRESLGLTQAEFERALGIGSKTVIRWEKGKVLPGQAMAMLLLLIKRDPTAIEYLAKRSGLFLSLPPRMPFKVWTGEWSIEALESSGVQLRTPVPTAQPLALVA